MDKISNGRPQVTEEEVTETLETIQAMLEYRLEQKGRGAYASRHECLGIVEEEIHELREAVRSGELTDVGAELIDIAVAAIFGLASINSDKVDW